MSTTAYSGVTSTTSSNYTDKGTKIIKGNSQFDKDSFLKILSAELANQDPTQQQDSTQYVAQMAQFTNLEQMSNLNTTMQFMGASSIIGKTVTLNSYDPLGNIYSGVVQNVVKDGSTVKVSVLVGENETKGFDLSEVVQVK
ncbi:MAG: flagellar hook assembly protein FlgD [Solirubrobacterales bacterium]